MADAEGKKVKMGQVFREGDVIPVTFIELENNQASFEIGQKVTVSGRSKGRGFQGVIKRHGFSGASRTHGTKHTLRTAGSIGATGPARVLPGTKMAGRMGGHKVNVKNLKVVAYDKDRKLLAVKGALPGMRGSKVKVLSSEDESGNDN